MENTWLAGLAFPVDDVFQIRSGVFVGGKYYVQTGDQLYAYDTLAETWTRLADSVIGAEYPANLVRLGAFIYFAAGWFLDPRRLARYNTLTGVWEELAPMIGAHYSSNLAVANGKVYSIGGGGTGLAVEEYTPETNTWVAKGNTPNPKEDSFLATVNNKIHAIAGNPSVTTEQRHDIYDPSTDSWTSAPDIVRATGNAYYGSAVAFGKYIFTLSVAENEFWMYDTVSGEWTKKLAPVFEGDPKSFGASDTLLYAQHRTSFQIYTPDVTGGGASFFDGVDGPTITPAPEKLPHVITLEDAGGNKSFQRKLQDNFDTIERQLLALDVDNQGNKDPNR